MGINLRRPLLGGAPALFVFLSGCDRPSDAVFGEDIRLSAAAEEALAGRPGAVVVLDIGTGRIRAMAGTDTAVGTAFSPGSLVKLVTVWKGIEEGTLTPETRFVCNGRAEFSGKRYQCWFPPGHGDLDLVHGIAFSCNLYFLSLADRIGPDATYRGLIELGFGRETGINLPGEAPGRVSPPADGLGREYLIGDTDGVAATPLQVITYLSALVNGGAVWVPGVTETREEIEAFRPTFRTKIDASRASPILMKGMRDAVAFGTGMKAAVGGHEIMGKTGTGSVPGAPWATSGWFLGFAPAESPRIAVVVFLCHGMGGEDAAPAAAKVFRAYFEEDNAP